MTTQQRAAIFILTGMYFFTAARVNAQRIEDTRISISMENAPIEKILRQIETITPFTFFAKAEDIEKLPPVTIHANNRVLTEILNNLFNGRFLSYRQEGKNIIIRKLVSGETNSASRSGRYTIHGTVRSAKTGESIIGASITTETGSLGTITNAYGFYSLTLPGGEYRISVSAVGMKTEVLPISLSGDRKVDISLEEEASNLEEVTVVASASGRSLRSPQTGMERLTMKEIKDLPVLFGERDILKTIQLLPGVKQAGEGNSGFYVRGGAADQNLILLDEAPVYNASHLLGFFSTFNSDAIKNVTLYKGDIPAFYGGRLSSVVDVKMNDGNSQDFGVSGGIGLIATRLNIEGPIQKDRSSFLISGRRTYADMFLKLLGDSSLRTTRLYFYDLNLKANYKLGEKDHLYLSGYFGRDVLSQERLAGINWGNATGTLRWNHIFNKKLFSNTSLIYSNYDYRIDINGEATDFRIFSQIKDWNIKEELQWYVNSKNTINAGINAIYHTITPGEISVRGSLGDVENGLPQRYSLDNAIFAMNTWKPHNRWGVVYGLRLSAFSILGKGDYYHFDAEGKVTDTLNYKKGEVVKTYLNPEPRIAVSYQSGKLSSIKASYSRNTQNLHLIQNTGSSSPTDKWVASTNIIKPEISDQVAIGYYKNLNDTRYELTIETYYKKMQNQIDYRNGAQVFTNQPIESQLLFGEGRAYGIEGLIRKKAGRLTGWLGYTVAKTERKINGINNDRWYNARQDRTHDVSIVAIYRLNNKWTLSGNWVFYTGDAVTYPAGKYAADGEVYFYYTERNGSRMPDYHRLDLGATLQLKKSERFSSELNLSIFNAYGRANAYQINFRQSEEDPSRTEAVKISLFTFVPSVTYNFKF